jgi:hypothetical protein
MFPGPSFSPSLVARLAFQNARAERKPGSSPAAGPGMRGFVEGLFHALCSESSCTVVRSRQACRQRMEVSSFRQAGQRPFRSEGTTTRVRNLVLGNASENPDRATRDRFLVGFIRRIA